MKLIWRRFKSLGLFIFGVFILIPVLVFGEDYLSGFQLSSGYTKILDLTAIGVGKVCVTNNSGSSYFIPTKTYPEWASFAAAMARLNVSAPSGGCCGDGVCQSSTMETYPATCFNIPSTPGCETPTTCWADCASKCDYQPSGVYASVLYTAQTNCGGTPACTPIYPPAVQAGRPYGTTPSPLPSVSGAQENGGCGFLQIQRSSQCASLIKPPYSLCEGDPCVTGLQAADYRTPSFCVGTYDSLLNTCIYRSRDNRTIPWGGSAYIDTYKSFNHLFVGNEYGVNATPVTNNGAVGSWGACYTTVPCGDGICSSGYGETCSSCSSDCGACATIYCWNNNQCANYYCEGLSAQCEGSYECNNYYDEGTCSYYGCYWNVINPGTCVGF